MESSEDPGIKGKKLSKSGDSGLEERNKSFDKVLTLLVAWVRAKQSGDPNADELKTKWLNKSAWHEKTFGW